MNQTQDKPDLRKRTLEFAMRVLKLSSRIPFSPEGAVIRRQLVKSGTSPGAHYREASRARSGAEFISKMEGGLQELDETGYWLELLRYSDTLNTPEVDDLAGEVDELIRIFMACVKNVKEARKP